MRAPRLSIVPRLLLLVGGLFMGGGAWLLLSDSAEHEVARVSGLARSEPGAFHSLPVGRSVLLEGKLLAREPLGPHGFVAYRREQYLRTETSGASKGKQQWMQLGTVTPRIAIEGAGGVVEVSNRNYILKNWPHHWQTHVLPHHRSLVDATERFNGFRAGDSVTVDGRVVEGPSPGVRRIESTALSAGDSQAYIADVRGGVVVFKVVGGVFVGLGAILTIVGLLLRRATSKRLAASKIKAGPRVT